MRMGSLEVAGVCTHQPRQAAVQVGMQGQQRATLTTLRHAGLRHRGGTDQCVSFQVP